MVAGDIDSQEPEATGERRFRGCANEHVYNQGADDKNLATHIAKLNNLIAQGMKPHQEAVMRLAEVPGLGVDSAQQIIAEVGQQASTFPSAAELTSWVGTCPGKDESAEQNHSSRSAKGNKYLRRVAKTYNPDADAVNMRG